MPPRPKRSWPVPRRLLHEEVQGGREGDLRTAAAEKKLAGAAKTSFTKKCMGDAVGDRQRADA
jgi:hypothetical protein